MAFKWKEPKDPQEVLDYVVEWQPPASGTKVPRLDEGDVIINSTWPNPPIGITIRLSQFRRYDGDNLVFRRNRQGRL